MKIKTGYPSVDEIVDLLNSSFHGWGDDRYFHWKFDEFPGYSHEHSCYIEQKDEVIAFSRAFARVLVSEPSGKQIPSFIGGDSVVAKGFRQQGMYSKLLKHREIESAKIKFTFTKIDSIPFKLRVKDNWLYMVLPLKMKILSPSKVIGKYADLVLNDKGWLNKFFSTFGKAITLDFSDDSIHLSELVVNKNSSCSNLPSIRVKLSNFATHKLVGAVVSQGGLLRNLPTLACNVFHKGGPEKVKDRISRNSRRKFKFEHKESLTEQDLKEVHNLYTGSLKNYDFHFRRDDQDISHMLSYPFLVDILLARKDGLKGFAVVGRSPGVELEELRVLDLIYEDQETFRALVEEIEEFAKLMDADSILLVSKNSLSSWASIRSQVIMWKCRESGCDLGRELQNSSLLINFYDIY